MILESGNLLCMARLGFRVKRNNQFWEIPQSQNVVCLYGADIFYGIRLFV